MKLIVREPFDAYRRGEEITDAAQIASALTAHPGHVLKVGTAAPNEPSVTEPTSAPVPQLDHEPE